jgi:hypothetical protein
MLRTRLIVAGIFVVAAACSSTDMTSSGTTSATDLAITSDAADAAADGFAEDVDVMTGMDGRIGNISADGGSGSLIGPFGWRPGLTGCSFANGAFTCPDTLKNGLNVSRVVTFKDAAGETETAYDSLLTASIGIVADISGDRTHGPWTATVARHRELDITGLAGIETTRTVNGNGHETVSSSRVTRNDSTRSYSIVASSVITDVVMPVRMDGGNGWPISGTITRTMTITITSGPNTGKTETRTFTLTFDGTSTPTARVNGQNFIIDCVNHTAAPHG